MLAHKLTRRLSQVRKEEILDYLRPDGKSQVTVEYDGDKPVRVEAVIISAQHSSLVKIETIREDILEKVIHAVIPSNLLDSKTKYFINPTGRFVVGGPQGDCGLTGRKIIVDTYGGVGSHGGGAFSGKDPTKVDRSASYMARHIAKNIVAAGLADQRRDPDRLRHRRGGPGLGHGRHHGHGQGRGGQDRGGRPRDLPARRPRASSST